MKWCIATAAAYGIAIRYDTAHRAIPLLICDVCKETIRDAKLAAVVLAGDGEPPAYVCKGACHDQAEARLQPVGHEHGWMELQHFLVLVLRNLGLSASEVAEAMRLEEVVGE